MVVYCDTSALVKLVVAEAETAALSAWIAANQPTLISSDLARTELLRAVRRVAPNLAVQAKAVLDSIMLTTLDSALFDGAGRLDPAILRTLDALHIAAALELGDDLDGFITYDDRLAEAVRLQGIQVIAPR